MSAERDTQQGTRGTRGMRLSEIDTDTTSDRGRERIFGRYCEGETGNGKNRTYTEE